MRCTRDRDSPYTTVNEIYPILRYALCGLAFAALASCERAPSVVYIPVEPPRVTVEASISTAEAAVGEQVILHARRFYRGQWKQVERSSLPKDACWLRRPPSEQENEVADNIHWTVRPKGRARFDQIHRVDRTRTVVFSAPGRFRITGSSSVWCGSPVAVVPETLVVDVREK